MGVSIVMFYMYINKLFVMEKIIWEHDVIENLQGKFNVR
ncbi:hypothetical protein EMUCRT_0830 [Ehrlichia cf. muris str. EmCRT]|uniref:Uncharacterized protein n=1 Tax=Ehrlichia cf. muris str. EmCRT TaxID=1359167 RepID=A0A0F3N6L8_9RICK|nr:hypothetical protein EMUCRT_0830 [Ehrlichia cf. muris str. EmCRT]